MKNFKLKTLFIAMLAVILIPTTTLASSGWDYIGSDVVRGAKNGKNATWSKTFYSTGGDFRVCLSGFDVNGANDVVRVWLREKDNNNRSEVLNAYVTPHAEKIGSNGVACFEFRNIGKWVDGSNKKAEFQFKAQLFKKGENVTGKVYD